MTLLRHLLVSMALVTGMATSVRGEPAADRAELEQVIAECEKLKKECMRAQTETINKAAKDFERATSEAEKDRMLDARMEEARELMRPTYKEVFRQLEPYGDNAETVELLQWVAIGCAGEETGVAAAQLLARHHPLDPQILELSYLLRWTIYPWVEHLIESQLAHPELPYEMRWKLRVALAEHKRKVLEIAERLKFGDHVFEQQCRKSHGAARVEQLKNLEGDAEELEILHLLDELRDDYPRERLDSGYTITQFAEAAEFAIVHLRLGSIVPDIRGTDLDGTGLRLTDYERKVVLLVFWDASDHFARVVPLHNELRTEYVDVGFEIVGVVGDLGRAEAKSFVRQHKIEWRSIADGVEGFPISRQWNVTDWPMYYLIDRKGIIRAKNLTRREIRAHVERLLKEP